MNPFTIRVEAVVDLMSQSGRVVQRGLVLRTENVPTAHYLLVSCHLRGDIQHVRGLPPLSVPLKVDGVTCRSTEWILLGSFHPEAVVIRHDGAGCYICLGPQTLQLHSESELRPQQLALPRHSQ